MPTDTDFEYYTFCKWILYIYLWIYVNSLHRNHAFATYVYAFGINVYAHDINVYAHAINVYAHCT